MYLENNERNDWRDKTIIKQYFQLAQDVREEIKGKKSNVGLLVVMQRIY